MKEQKDKRFKIWGKLCLLLIMVLTEAVLFQQTSLVANAQGTVNVKASSGKIRESASTDSEVLASVRNGDKLDVIAQTTDSEGYTWYKVYVDGTKTGYIRADLVGKLSGTVGTEDNSDAADEDTSDNDDNDSKEQEQQEKEEEKKEDKEEEESSSQEVQFVQVKETSVTAGKVTGGKVNVRENPSTKATVVGKADAGTEVKISGESTDTEGKVWYQVSFNNVNGFIRSDYLEIVEEEEETTEEVPEETVEETVEEVIEEVVEEPVNQDYELVYEPNAEGVETWFLYDYTRETKQELETILTSVRQGQDEEKSAVSQLKTFKILAVVLAAIILALIVAVTILIFKLRDSYEYVYEDDDNDEDDEDDEDDDDDEDDEDDEDEVYRPAEKKAPFWKNAQPVKPTAPPVKTPAPAANTEAEKKETSWQSKNFLDIDDDMEFEFLDLK